MIRPARPEDVPTLAALIRDLAAYEKLSGEAVLREEDLHAHLFGPRPAAEVVVAENDGHGVVGFALYFQNFSTFLAKPGLYLEDLFVIPAARGHGYGKALLIHLAKLAVTRGYGRFEWSVLDWNEAALGFYRKLGAVPMGGWTVQRLTGDALHALAR